MSNRTSPELHWYRTYSGACPICGRVTSYRERVYGVPPALDDRSARFVRLPERETYDFCMEREALAA